MIGACAGTDDEAVENLGSVQQKSELGDRLNKAIPEDVKKLAQDAKEIAGVFTGVGPAVEVATTFLKMAGFLESSDPLQEKFDALAKHVDQVAGNLSWQIAAFPREQHLQDAKSAVVGAAEIINSGGVLSLNSPVNETSRNAVYEGEASTNFLRYYNESVTDGPPFLPFTCSDPLEPCYLPAIWKYWFLQKGKSYIPDHPDNYVYDWRLGVPALMTLISLRVQVIAALDNNFKQDDVFDAELQDHSNALQAQAQRMVDGVRCVDLSWQRTSDTKYAVICVDINTGHIERTSFTEAGPDRSSDPAFHTNILLGTQRRLTLQILAAMPLAAMQSLINTLDGYRNGSVYRANFSPVEAVIPSSLVNVNSGRCLDIAGSHFSSGATIEQYHCTGNPNQLWTFQEARWPGFRKPNGSAVVFPASKDGQAGLFLPLSPSPDAYASENDPISLWSAAPFVRPSWTFNRQNDGSYEIQTDATTDSAPECMDVAGSALGDYAKILQYHCTGNPNQRWLVRTSRQPFYLSRWFASETVFPGGSFFQLAPAPKLCVDVNGSTSAYSNVVQNACQDSGMFHLVDGGWTNGEHLFEIVSDASSLCLDVAGGRLTTGARIIQYPCRGTSNQLWSFSGTPQIFQPMKVKNAKSGMCLDVSGGALTGGSQMVQADCVEAGTDPTAQTQQFLVNPYGF